MASSTPRLAETLTNDWMRAVRFYARFGITQAQVRQRVLARIWVDRMSSESFDSESWSATWL